MNRKAVGAFFFSLIVLIISKTVGAGWKVAFILMAVAFFASWLFLVLAIIKRDDRLDIIEDWKAAGKARQKAQYAFTANARGYREEAINKYVEARNKECAQKRKKFSMKQNKCV